MELTTIGLEQQYEEYKNIYIYRKTFILVFVGSFIVYFYLTLSKQFGEGDKSKEKARDILENNKNKDKEKHDNIFNNLNTERENIENNIKDNNKMEENGHRAKKISSNKKIIK